MIPGLRHTLGKALAVLSPKLRAAVVLHYYEGLTREEIDERALPPAHLNDFGGDEYRRALEALL